MLCPNTRVRRACVEESLVSVEHGVAHITLALKKNSSIGILQDCQPTLPKDVGQCKPIHGLCAMPKSELANMAHQLPRTRY